MNRIIISGGGTGGHIYPALAIADTLRQRSPEIQILFIGAYGKMEMEKVPDAGYPIRGLWIDGLHRKHFFRNILFPVKLIVSVLHSFFILSFIGRNLLLERAVLPAVQWYLLPVC